LHALARLGFLRTEGVDASPRLAAQYSGPARILVADCRNLPFADQSKEILIVQGGLHHLPKLPDDLERTLAEMQRVLRKNGRVVLVEPWLTPFLKFVHAVCANRLARRLSPKLDALQTMIEHEQRTYDQWLAQPGVVQRAVHSRFKPVIESIAWGKWNFVGTPL
jgi:ubiquinone/menaquinone biosynthesis C-methylase UbiE